MYRSIAVLLFCRFFFFSAVHDAVSNHRYPGAMSRLSGMAEQEELRRQEEKEGPVLKLGPDTKGALFHALLTL